MGILECSCKEDNLVRVSGTEGLLAGNLPAWISIVYKIFSKTIAEIIKFPTQLFRRPWVGVFGDYPKRHTWQCQRNAYPSADHSSSGQFEVPPSPEILVFSPWIQPGQHWRTRREYHGRLLFWKEISMNVLLDISCNFQIWEKLAKNAWLQCKYAHYLDIY